jgi:phospholipid/cholesterol/gamma-HCH transport system substrate-binding protein
MENAPEGSMKRESQLRWTQVRIGLLVLMAVGILVVMIMNLQQGVGVLSAQERFRAIVPHTQGLKVGGPVRMNGVDVGNVREIGITDQSAQVEISFTVTRQAAGHMHQDAAASIRPMGLLGDKYLEIAPGSPNKPLLPPGSIVAGQAEPDFTGLATGATATIERLNQTVAEIQRLLVNISQGEGTAARLIGDSALYDRSQRILEKLEAASEKSVALLEKVERGEGTVGRLLADRDLYNRANQAIQELTTLTGRLNNQEGTLAKLADPALYQRLEDITQRGGQLLTRVERGDGTIGKLVTRDELYTRTDKLLTDVEELVADVKKHPTKYFKITVF